MLYVSPLSMTFASANHNVDGNIVSIFHEGGLPDLPHHFHINGPLRHGLLLIPANSTTPEATGGTPFAM